MNLRQRIWDASGLNRSTVRPCTCRDSVPMPAKDGEFAWRIECAFCWTSTRTFQTATNALAAWNGDSRYPYVDQDDEDDED